MADFCPDFVLRLTTGFGQLFSDTLQPWMENKTQFNFKTAPEPQTGELSKRECGVQLHAFRHNQRK